MPTMIIRAMFGNGCGCATGEGVGVGVGVGVGSGVGLGSVMVVGMENVEKPDVDAEYSTSSSVSPVTCVDSSCQLPLWNLYNLTSSLLAKFWASQSFLTVKLISAALMFVSGKFSASTSMNWNTLPDNVTVTSAGCPSNFVTVMVTFCAGFMTEMLICLMPNSGSVIFWIAAAPGVIWSNTLTFGPAAPPAPPPPSPPAPPLPPAPAPEPPLSINTSLVSIDELTL